MLISSFFSVPPRLINRNLTMIKCSWLVGFANNICVFEVQSKPKITDVEVDISKFISEIKT